MQLRTLIPEKKKKNNCENTTIIFNGPGRLTDRTTYHWRDNWPTTENTNTAKIYVIERSYEAYSKSKGRFVIKKK